MFYSFYKRRENALHFFNLSLALNKSLVEEGIVDTATLSHNYAVFSSTFRELDEPQLAQIYMDSCLLYGGRKPNWIQIEQAFIFTLNKQFKEAIQIIEKLIPWFEKEQPSYLVLIYHYLGDAYRGEGMLAKSETCYQNALSIAERYHSHLNFSILVHEKLADLYSYQGNYLRTAEELKKVLQLERLYFDSRSENNRPLLEIQDEFRKEMENRAQLLKEQRLDQLEHENKISFLQKTLISGLLVFLLLFGMLYFYYLRNKHLVEKQLIKKEKELEAQKNKELLEMKNKELATSALKLIEKDEFLQELKDRVNDKNERISLEELKHLIQKATINNAENWSEFEARFVAVNKGFYKKLKENFPKLTQGDRKLSALVKLKFTSKEISRLMGISVESVHTTRYRLRKKLGVTKGVDLEDFMSRF